MKILVTGCAGYIGGTFTYEALKKGYKVIGIDNFINSEADNIDNLKNRFKSNFLFYEYDISNLSSLSNDVEFNEM